MAKSVAFALAGLGGFNAHGAGFLAAAGQRLPDPGLVTATSGQILVLADWLEDRELKKTKALLFEGPSSDPFAQLRTLVFGHRGVFEPAYRQAVARGWTPLGAGETPAEFLADRLWPAQLYAPTRTEETFREAAESFNRSSIGVVFNAYDFRTGFGALYGNDAARALWPEASKVEDVAPSQDPRIRRPPPAKVGLRPIDAEAVKAALWLSLYGFDSLPRGQMDGAYHRSCIVSELYGFDRVFAVRPLAFGWNETDPPRNWFDVQDWQTEMWFSASYKAEIAGMSRINDLIAAGALIDPRFKPVELVEVAAPTPGGYFSYFVEQEQVFEDATEVANACFDRLGYPA
ncbi:hypothetical protein [Hansschlegelia zhihuaiae]|uniref:Uncharacterized protein n=1 Tax=Hansschlegelia zhihuaiae TaxID=405005 RepID=A0A4Q0MM18_9HYPH|nr:hypothetical protein [Hansschlegelia zhihuaiae]RXF74801.1 hypothetical protein EK403_05345 [Hansschlegelia zhihuaiae]